MAERRDKAARPRVTPAAAPAPAPSAAREATARALLHRNLRAPRELLRKLVIGDAIGEPRRWGR